MPSTTKLILGRVVPACAILAASGVAGLFGLELMRARAEREIYRDRLAVLTATYDDLAGRYNTAVRRTAMTELVVENGTLSVVVQSAAGRITDITTPYDPASEIYVDYAIIGGRVWIRRIFDEHTAPSEAMVIDPAAREHRLGRDPERGRQGDLPEPRRGPVDRDGRRQRGLGLRKAEPGEEIALGPAPAITDFDEIDAEAARTSGDIDWRDLLARVLGN